MESTNIEVSKEQSDNQTGDQSEQNNEPKPVHKPKQNYYSSQDLVNLRRVFNLDAFNTNKPQFPQNSQVVDFCRHS